ncbi:ABC transporter ATP-binding protein [Octadecabacter antarcticus 307]|uniref:ABC transporter ATP-binding protein n=1 Tax=Octadecabacter antarcticus 307 TaxID=391626 RepID=M9RCU9_9RHOB|nr:ABC transporter ATP-binding protein [Octadecabacter antarcticus]AGI67655.1 ABC transporter ATP-binding protein [Octadecabacter antarcticus 307]
MARITFNNVNKIYPDGTPAVSSLNMEIASGEFLCIVGPSGCGKSSTLRMLAGLERVSSGHILIDGEDVSNTPARDRDIAMVFENYALYPHLTVRENIAMPLVARNTPKAETQSRVADIAGRLSIESQLNKKPAKLSGGQRQRVALARAMIRSPRMFIMDEPLGHLEAYLRVELRREIRALHENSGGTTIYITHDQEEAAAISDRIAVMSRGVLQQVGTFKELIDHPVNRTVAEFVGEPPISILEDVKLTETGVMLGDVEFSLPAASIRRANKVSGPFALGVRPRDFQVVAKDDVGIGAKVRSVQPMGEWAILLCDTAAGALTVVNPTASALRLESEIRLSPVLSRVHLFAADGTNLSVEENL